MFRRVVHPGVVLGGELEELGMSVAELARQIDVPPALINKILSGECAITADTAARLGHRFDMDPQFWLNLQSQCDLVEADLRTFQTLRAEVSRKAQERGLTEQELADIVTGPE